MFLSLRGVTKRFGEVTAVDHIDLDLEEGSFVCFLGPSGCGKTTLLRLIAGLETLNEGEILLEGNDLAGLPARKRNFGVVFQSYSLFPNLTVARNIAYGLECRKWGRRRVEARVAEMLATVHLATAAHQHPHELSGGMQQRVALARALAPEPAVLLLDEPLSALDAKVRETLRGEIRDLQQRLGITTVMVTHDQDEAMEMADTIVVMNRGRIEQSGTAEELYWEPTTRFVGEFIGRLNILEAPELRAAAGGSEDDSVLAIRPEHVSVGDAGMLEGTIRKVAFLGNTMRLGIESATQSLEVELHGRRERLNVGDRIRFALPAERVRRLAAKPR
jgi:iron(III) transport system ATP-binding protein